MNGKTSGLFRAIVQFLDPHGEPLRGEQWQARIFDQDILVDDRLGRAGLDEDGKASFLIPVSDIMSGDSPGERNPDLYFRLFLGDREVFRSEVIEDVDFESLHRVSGEPTKITRQFGPYVVSLEA
ncbi:MAG: hypothetical protein HKO64_04480 [Xanthomonadales bacterium]|nr:hypothetical protein [Xanthomonadales bacterium]NNL94855.1 hypothetical protein [Xanthomonadales bacterium]